jgi:hypothetical protein
MKAYIQFEIRIEQSYWLKNKKIGPSDFTWGFRSKIIKMTCHPTWHTLWLQKIGPKVIKGMFLRWRPNFLP